jgi:hypothetical protein
MAKMAFDAYMKRYIKSSKVRSRIWKASVAEAVKSMKGHFVVVAGERADLRNMTIVVPKGKGGILVAGDHSCIEGCIVTGPHARKAKNKSKSGVTVR